MKCLKNHKTNQIIRVPDKTAAQKMRDSENWQYCPKKEWKNRKKT